MAESPLFSPRQMQMLTAIVDTLAPSVSVAPDPAGLFARKASDLAVPAVMADILAKVVDPGHLELFKLTLDLLDQPLLNGLLSRNGQSFLTMSHDERTAILHAWAESPVAIQRYGFQAFKRFALFLFYSVLDADGRNPNWPAIGYAGPAVSTAARPANPIVPAVLDADTSADVVIVGSGAGGGVVAAELSAAGLSVIVLEKGIYDPAFSGRELHSVEKYFENRGFLATDDLGVVLLAGSTLGGGTMINWAASLRTPEHVLKEWETDYGVTGFTGATFQKALDAVCARLSVNTKESIPNAQNAALERGALALGYRVGVVPRNVKGCQDCGFCNFGCSFGAKQGTVQTYLQDACQRGTKIVTSARVDRVLVKNGRAAGVQATVDLSDGRRQHITIRAKAVVVAAGALQTPAVLLRSGFGNAHIGHNLHLHPTTVTYGVYADPVPGWQGPMISRYVTQFNDLDGEGYGVTLETAPTHPGIAAFTLPWLNGQQHKETMHRLDHLANIIILTRDRDGGSVTIDGRGEPVIHYKLSARDGEHMMRGLVESLRVHRAAGAIELSAPHTTPLSFREGDFEDYLRRVQAAGLRKNTFALFSAHQMSSCRMGGNPALGAIDPGGEAFEVRGLFVADGSALPTPSGVNPMITIMGVAHLIAQNVKSQMRHGRSS
ncbi:MAG TPA: GMC family oxidoreductase N-terminal domain-containing protein [Aggregatilineales bacterium]|nr:GMC family oxidoreductase N-terminal domain-containing protein [Aggregatilineales bacterium]